MLLAAVALVIYGETRPLQRAFYGSVKDLLPTEAELPGWKVEYLPIADTPEMQAKVDEKLNYDDAVYAVYTKGAERLSFYIAYWTPGKMSPRLIAGHTPDVCWVREGWNLLEHSQWKPHRAPAGQARRMSKSGQVEYVVFWHFVGNVVQSYGTVGAPPWYAFFGDMLRSGLRQRTEQLFVRVSSNRAFQAWETTPAFGVAIEKLFASPAPLSTQRS